MLGLNKVKQYQLMWAQDKTMTYTYVYSLNLYYIKLLEFELIRNTIQDMRHPYIKVLLGNIL